MISVRYRVSFLALTWLVGVGAPLGNAQPEQISCLASDVMEERETALINITRERDQAGATIFNELKSLPPGDNDGRFQQNDKMTTLVRAAGVLRLPECVPFLVENIEMTLQMADEGIEEKKTLDAYYPALRSLIEIGSPCIPFLLGITEQETTELRRRLAVVALVRIFGNRSDYVAAVLETMKNTARDEVSRASLKKAQAILDMKAFMTAP